MTGDRDPNVLARQLADALDALATEQDAHAETRERLAVVDWHRTVLGVVAEQARALAAAVRRDDGVKVGLAVELAGLEEWLGKLAVVEDGGGAQPAQVLALGHPGGLRWEAIQIQPGTLYSSDDTDADEMAPGWWVIGTNPDADPEDGCDVLLHVDHAVDADGEDATEATARALADHLNGDAS